VEVRVSVELRDRFFALSAGEGSAEQAEQYRAQVDAIDVDPVASLDGLDVSWHPSARFKAVRYVDAELIDERVRDLFARPSAEAPYLAAVFVDPCELSFRTFESIVPLDRLFEGVPLELEPTEWTEHAEGVFSFSLQMPAQARERLARLDELNLYVPPLNAATRGGERFIFHSALLAEALSAAVADTLPSAIAQGFSHVNPVFRCNRFGPEDANFHRHRDTPYFDHARHHISRYTVLIYLTGGAGAPALDLPGAALHEIGEFTCVVFDQRFEHEGAPYREGRKVFLRTELVFTVDEVAEVPQIGELFSKACYLTGESVFAPELARHADAYYNQVAAAHWNGLGEGPARETFLHKEFRGMHFVANGYDFWFAKSDGLPLIDCAAITLLDYFNCKIDGAAFRSLCDTEIIESDNAGWIPDFLHTRSPQCQSAITRIDKALLFPEPEEPNGQCCPNHGPGFDPTRHDDLVKLYAKAQSFTQAHILPAPILMLGQDIALDPDRFVIRDDRIHVLGRELTPVNFAACWNDGSREDDYLNTEGTVGVAQLLVPPITFTESAGCYHLGFDFFRNAWMVDHRQAVVPVPRFTDAPWADPDDSNSHAWLMDVDRSLADTGIPLPASEFWDEEEYQFDLEDEDDEDDS
jgi:hypothetical protein